MPGGNLSTISLFTWNDFLYHSFRRQRFYLQWIARKIEVPVKEKLFIFYYDHGAKSKQYYSMNNLAVRVGAENFHGEAEQQMLTNL